jgi:hypothetical protein
VKITIEAASNEILRADLRKRLANRIRHGDGIDRGDSILEASRQSEP